MAHYILGIILILACCWKRGLSRVFLAYWVFYDCQEIYQPFVYGKGLNLYMALAYIVYYCGLSTNHWVVDSSTIVAGYLFCTWLWPLYAMGDLEPLASGPPCFDPFNMLFMVASSTLMHCMYSGMGYLFVDAEDPRASQE